MCAQWLRKDCVLSSSVSAPFVHNRLPFRVSSFDPKLPRSERSKIIFSVTLPPGYEKMPHFILLSRCIPDDVHPPGNADQGDRLLLYSVGSSNDEGNMGNYLAVHLMRKKEVEEIMAEDSHTFHDLPTLRKIDCSGFIVGIKLSADERYLVINVRRKRLFKNKPY